MKRSDNYACNQVKIILSELKSANHNGKLKALQNFKNYVTNYKPEISDDTVDFLFTGSNSLDGSKTFGLLYWCGVDSDKHGGKLKRICAPVVSLVRWLVHEPDEVYISQFTRLPQEDLLKMNFPKHILGSYDGDVSSTKVAFKITATRSGSSEDAFVLLHILANDHRNLEDEPDPIDLDYLLQGNKVCRDKFSAWLNKSNFEIMNEELANRGKAAITKAIERPTRWDRVTFKPVPLQEGEEVGSAEADEGPLIPPPINDPLRIRDVDLRSTQEVVASGGLQRRLLMNRKAAGQDGNNTLSMASSAAASSSAAANERNRTRSMYVRDNLAANALMSTMDDEYGYDEDYNDEEDGRYESGAEKKMVPSVIPSDKSFSIALFLSLVHGGSTFNELSSGLSNLREHLKEQSTRRVNLVRNHFGLFSQCAEGLEWLRDYRRGKLRVEEGSTTNNKSSSSAAAYRSSLSPGNLALIDKGMEKLKRAQGTLELAKVEAKNTLAPILERMKRSRDIKSAEKVLKGISSLIDYPRSMKIALERGELKDVVALYQRVSGIPTTSGLKMAVKIKAAAESVILDLKRTCYFSMLSPQSSVSMIMRHAEIILELEGSVAYLKALRIAFLRQMAELLKNLKEAKERMINDAGDAFDQGQELNLATKNAALLMATTGNNTDMDSLVTIVKRYLNHNHHSSNHRLRRHSKSSDGGNSGSSRYEMNHKRSSGRESTGGGTTRMFRQPSTASNHSNGSGGGHHHLTSKRSARGGGGGGGSFGDEDGFTEQQPSSWVLEGDENSSQQLSLQQEWIYGNNNNHDYNDNNNQQGRHQHHHDSLEELMSEYDLKTTMDLDQQQQGGGGGEEDDRDFSELLCHIVRKTFTERIIDIVSRWFPNLFRLACEIATYQLDPRSSLDASNSGKNNNNNNSSKYATKGKDSSTSSSTQSGGSGSAGTRRKSGGSGNGSGASACRILGIALNIAADNLHQAINGLRPSFLAVTVPQDIVAAIIELDQETNTLQSSLSLSLPSIDLDYNSIMAGSSRFLDLINNLIFQIPIKQQFDALSEVFDLHEAVEVALKNVVQKVPYILNGSNHGGINNNNNGGGGSGTKTVNFVVTNNEGFFRPFANTAANSNANSTAMAVLSELDYTGSVSPFHEPMKIFSALAKESERAVAQRILDRLIDRGGNISETLLFESNAEALYSLQSIYSLGKRITFADFTGVEVAVEEFEKITCKGMFALVHLIRRPEWISAQVYDAIVQRLFLSLAERLRRKSLLIEDMKGNTQAAPGINIRGSLSPPKRLQKKMNTRVSMTQDALLMVGLEEDLRLGDIGWQRNFNVTKTKNGALIDFIRGCVRMRSSTIPRILKKLLQVFLMEEKANYASNNNASSSTAADNASSSGGGGGNSLLNRLFVVDTNDDSTPSGSATSSSAADGGRRRGTKFVRRASSLFGGGSSTAAADTTTTASLSTTESPAIKSDSFSDRILARWCDTYYEFADSHSPIGKLVLPCLTDIIKLESDAVDQYVQYRLKGLRTMLFTSYTYIVEQDLHSAMQQKVFPSNNMDKEEIVQLPNHITRLLLALYEEKKVLTQALDDLSLNSLTSKKVFMRDAKLDDDHWSNDGDDDEDFGEEIEKNFIEREKESLNNYSKYIYQRLAVSLISLYQELLKKLFNGTFGRLSSTVTATATISTVPQNPFKQCESKSEGIMKADMSHLPVKSVFQAIEELEFLKAILRPIIFDVDALQQSALTPIEINNLNSCNKEISKSVPKRNELLQAGQFMIILV